MDVSKIIESKISNYFSKKAGENACNISSLSLLIERPNLDFKKEYPDKKVKITLYFNGDKVLAELDEVLNLSFFEKMATSSNKVAEILLDNIQKYEKEFNANAQIVIYSSLKYFALSNYKKQKQITINDIL